MSKFHIAPLTILLFSWTCHCQYYDAPYGRPPYFGDPYQYPPYIPPGDAPYPQGGPLYSPVATSYSNLDPFNPFLGQAQNRNQVQQQQQQNSQQIQPNYPNLPSVPFQTVKPSQKVDRYPFPGIDANSLNPQPPPQGQQPSFANVLLNQQYPNLPTLPFQTITPGQVNPSLYPLLNNPNIYNKPKIELPRIRVIEFPSSDYFEYGGGKLVQPKRPNADLYVGGSGGDVPMTSKIFIECTGPNQVEWLFSGSNVTKKDLSVVTKNFQITIPEERGPTPGSREYTYLRLGLEDQISEKDAGVYTCRDRVLPQNYITIRVIVAKPVTGRPNYPFRPKDPNTIYYSDSDSQVVLPCKIENADATISLHRHEQGKLSCPYTMDGRVIYDRFRGFIMQTKAFKDLEGRYVCVGDFGGELRLMKYKLVRSNDFTSRYVEGEPQNIIALDSKNSGQSSSPSSSTAFLAKVDTLPNNILSGLTGNNGQSNLNLTAAGLVDPRSEFEIETQESFTLPQKNEKEKTIKTTDIK